MVDVGSVAASLWVTISVTNSPDMLASTFGDRLNVGRLWLAVRAVYKPATGRCDNGGGGGEGGLTWHLPT